MFSQIVEINLVGGDPISTVTADGSPPPPLCSTSHLHITSQDLGKRGLLSIARPHETWKSSDLQVSPPPTGTEVDVGVGGLQPHPGFGRASRFEGRATGHKTVWSSGGPMWLHPDPHAPLRRACHDRWQTVVSKDFLWPPVAGYTTVKKLPSVQCNELSQRRDPMLESRKEGWGGNPKPHVQQWPIVLPPSAFPCSAGGEEHPNSGSCRTSIPGFQALLAVSQAHAIAFLRFTVRLRPSKTKYNLFQGIFWLSVRLI